MTVENKFHHEEKTTVIIQDENPDTKICKGKSSEKMKEWGAEHYSNIHLQINQEKYKETKVHRFLFVL